jgi:hypothetical protein
MKTLSEEDIISYEDQLRRYVEGGDGNILSSTGGQSNGDEKKDRARLYPERSDEDVDQMEYEGKEIDELEIKSDNPLRHPPLFQERRVTAEQTAEIRRRLTRKKEGSPPRKLGKVEDMSRYREKPLPDPWAEDFDPNGYDDKAIAELEIIAHNDILLFPHKHPPLLREGRVIVVQGGEIKHILASTKEGSA